MLMVRHSEAPKGRRPITAETCVGRGADSVGPMARNISENDPDLAHQPRHWRMLKSSGAQSVDTATKLTMHSFASAALA